MEKYILTYLVVFMCIIALPAHAETPEPAEQPAVESQMSEGEDAMEGAPEEIEPAASEESGDWEKGSNNFSATRDRGNSRDNQISADPDGRSNHTYMGRELNR